MAQVNARYEIRKAITAALANATGGFNAVLGSVCGEQGIPYFSIDFGATSPNFAQHHITPDSDTDEQQAITEFPAIVLYTSTAQYTGRTKNARFSGQIVAHVDLYLSFRERNANTHFIDVPKAEDVADCAEEALLRSIDLLSARNGTALLPTAIVYAMSGLAVNRSPITFYGDGYKQLIQILIPFEVTQ